MSALMIGLSGTALTAVECDQLADPAVAGAILFTRNYRDRAQLQALCASIRGAAPDAVIAVDQEGGRVQRFAHEYTRLPPLAEVGALYDRQPAAARRAARLHAEIMAVEVLADGVDLSFAPVADLARGNLAIGNRAFHADPRVCAELVTVYADTMQQCGMPATLKHFPGHGSVLADTHTDRAIDDRPLLQLLDEDLLPFATAVLAGARAVMMAHVEYPHAATPAAGYSIYWIRQVLRAGLGFKGVVISDDIGMAAGAQLGEVTARLDAHAQAGCDLILVCDPALVAAALAGARSLGFKTTATLSARLRGKLRKPHAREREHSTWASRAARLTGLLA